MSIRMRTAVWLMVLAMLGGGMLALAVRASLEADSAGAESRSESEDGAAGDRNETGADVEAGLSPEQIEKLNAAYRLIEEKYFRDYDDNELIDEAIEGMLSALEDPYTVYMDKEESEQFESSVIESSFSGIGAEVTLVEGIVTVISPIKGVPAEQAGIRANDRIVTVNGERLEGLSLNEAVQKIRGPKGTQAKLGVLRGERTEPIEIIVVRDEIDIETVASKMLEANLGLITISQFAQNTADRFHEELGKLEEQGLEGLIIDVRSNPGGILPVVINTLEPLIPAGKTIVQVEDRDGRRDQSVSSGSGKAYPITVLINKGSASASEILAAALNESADASLVGTRTFGKGTVQMAYALSVGDGSNIKLTIAKWLTPEGRFISGEGIAPEYRVELPEYFMLPPLQRKQTLAFDDNNADVVTLQSMLESLGYAPGRKDGYFSRETEAAVKQFQEKHGLKVTGTVGDETADRLEEELVGLMLDPANDKQMAKAIEITKQQINQ